MKRKRKKQTGRNTTGRHYRLKPPTNSRQGPQPRHHPIPSAEELYEKTKGWALARAILSGVEDPEVVFHDAFLGALRGFRPELGSFESRLFVFLTWRLASAYRSERKRRRLVESLLEDLAVVDLIATERARRCEWAEFLEVLLETLPARDRKLIHLKYYEDLSLAEIAKRL